jgi:membrane-bound lytic murein transglycosylase B
MRRTTSSIVLFTLGVVLLAPLASAPLRAQSSAPAMPSPQAATERSFGDWLAGFRAEALSKGIRAETLDQAFAGIEPLPIVLERDQTQPELTLPLDKYLARRLTRRTVSTARQMSSRHAALLRQVSTKYGVPQPVIVAVWGLESNFGRFSGVRPTIPTLATLAYQTRRAAFFRGELLDALTILDRGDIDLASMRGSWAGAMGQTQFMPSSYLKYAEDFDRDGRRDIWNSEADVFASIANYLKSHGWSASQRWGRAVRVPAGAAARISDAAPLRLEGCDATRQLTQPLPLSRWRQLGVRASGGRELPKSEIPASLLHVEKRSFLVYPNYEALLAYNCAHAYALSVGLLSDRIGTR